MKIEFTANNRTNSHEALLAAAKAICNSSDYGEPLEGRDNRPLMRALRAAITQAERCAPPSPKPSEPAMPGKRKPKFRKIGWR